MLKQFICLMIGLLIFLSGCGDPQPPGINPTPGTSPTPAPEIPTEPVARAGDDQINVLGYTIYLDGSNSFDPDGNSLSFQWEFTALPGTSALTDTALVSPDSATCNFLPDVRGLYVLQLTVSDGTEENSNEVNVSIVNDPPVANAGTEQTTDVSVAVNLDGSGSYNPNAQEGDLLTYSWQVQAQPAGATPVLTGTETATPQFIPDLEGVYILELSVDDSYDTDTDTVNVYSLAAGSGVIDIVLE